MRRYPSDGIDEAAKLREALIKHSGLSNLEVLDFSDVEKRVMGVISQQYQAEQQMTAHAEAMRAAGHQVVGDTIIIDSYSQFGQLLSGKLTGTELKGLVQDEFSNPIMNRHEARKVLKLQGSQKARIAEMNKRVHKSKAYGPGNHEESE